MPVLPLHVLLGDPERKRRGWVLSSAARVGSRSGLRALSPCAGAQLVEAALCPAGGGPAWVHVTPTPRASGRTAQRGGEGQLHLAADDKTQVPPPGDGPVGTWDTGGEGASPGQVSQGRLRPGAGPWHRARGRPCAPTRPLGPARAQHFPIPESPNRNTIIHYSVTTQ